MKKGQVGEGIIEKIDFPNKGIIHTENGEKVIVKNGIPGQKVRFLINKKRKGSCEGRLLEVVEKSPWELEEKPCPHFGSCGGCLYQNLPYEQQLKLKEDQVRNLLEPVISGGNAGEENGIWPACFEGIKPSPRQFAYRNKMEFSFGDEYKDGPLTLGMHKRGSFYDLVTVDRCKIVDTDYNQILCAALAFFSDKRIPYLRKNTHEGYLRHLLVRKAVRTGEILIDLITTTQTGLLKTCLLKEQESSSKEVSVMEMGAEEGVSEQELLAAFADCLLALPLEGKIAGILHTKNDSLADVVKDQGTEVLFGQDFFYEELLGLKFKISPFSFFQTNSLSAELLYETVREYVGALKLAHSPVVYDLYSGTGTIAQLLAPVAGKVIGVEIVEEAVEAAKANAALNGLSNCQFIAGDVLKVLDSIKDRPDYIILDPPRDGIHPKALEKILDYGADHIIYVSCKPTSLARDLAVFQERGYRVERCCCLDQFPGTVHVETVCLLGRRKPDDTIKVSVNMDDYYQIRDAEEAEKNPS